MQSLNGWIAVLRGAVVASACMVTPACGQSAPARDWAAQISPYVWAAGVGGSATPFPGGPKFEGEKSFFELLEDLDAAFFVTGLIRKGRFVAMFDASRTVSSRDGFVPTGNPQLPLVPAEGRLAQTSGTVLAGFRAVDGAAGTIDLMVGVRAFGLDATVRSAPLGVSRSPGASFADPVAGLRINIPLADGWSLLSYGDIGGFGAGSELTGQVAATVNVRAARRLWLSGGYRYLGVDYRGSRLRADYRMGGPLFGATATF